MVGLRNALGGALVVCALVTACSGGEPAGAPPSSGVSEPGTTSPQASEAPSSTPTPSTPSPADDAAALLKSFLTAKELGKKWKAEGKVQDLNPDHKPRNADPSAKGPDFCPGHPSEFLATLYSTDAGALGSFSTKSGDSLTVNTFTLDAADPAAMGTALANDLKACDKFKVKTSSGSTIYEALVSKNVPKTIAGGEMVGAYASEFYLDKNYKKFTNAGRTLYAVNGRAVVSVTYNSTKDSDPGDPDFSPLADVASKQLAKLAVAFG